jgi:type I restriction enzyme S subunit
MSAKTGWTRVAFGDVVRLARERSSDPEGDGFERYVGLEHIDPDDLRIRRWGNVSDGTTFTNVFRAGQVLFGKRRAYQRKVAVAHFDGVCSGDIYVLEPSGDRLLPGFLTFICQSDRFFEHAVGTSAGSLSPRTNWNSLAEFEFPLPPLGEQRRIDECLSAARVAREKFEAASFAAATALRATLLAKFNLPRTMATPLQTLCRSDITYGIVQAGPNVPGGVPYVRVSEMTNRDELDPREMMTTTPVIAAQYSRTTLDPGDIVVALRGVPGLAQQVPESMRAGNLSRGVARIAPSPEVNSRYLLWAIRSPVVQAAVRQYANGWKGEDLREITIAQLRELPVPVTSRAEQDEIASTLDLLDRAMRSCRRRASACRNLQSTLGNRVLAGVDAR